jgi:hypothetical protein
VGIQDFIRSLLPREDRLYGLLEKQAEYAHAAAKALAKLTTGSSAAEVGKLVQQEEHAGDKLVHEIEEALARTYVTPIDREDIHALAVEIDDVTDSTNQAARACELLGVEAPTEAMTAMIRMLLRTTEELASMVPKLRTRDYAGIFAAKARIRGLEKEADQVHRGAVSHLFKSADIDIKSLLREREVLEDIEDAIDHCERVADTLSNLAVKHG